MRYAFSRQSLAGAVVALAIVMVSVGAHAQAGRIGVRGTVESLDGNTLVVKSPVGTETKLTLAPNVSVGTLKKRALSDIKPGDFVASTGRPGTDGKLHAVEVRIFPAGSHVGEGQRPYDLEPNDKMTNATVTGIVSGNSGTTFKVQFNGQDSEYVVDPTTPILSPAPGDKSLLKPGIAVYASATKGADGALTTDRITAEADGVKPPM